MSRILVIEPSGFLGRLLGPSLTRSGMTCHAARTVVEALEWAAKIRPRLIVVDTSLPSRMGIEQVCSALRQAPGCHDVPFVLVSPHPDTAADLARRCKARTWFRKPLSPATFLQWLKENQLQEASATTKTPRPVPAKATKLILIVEKNPEIIPLLQESLLRAHCAIIAAGSMREALSLLAAVIPCAIVLNRNVNDMTIEEACRALNDSPRHADIPRFLVLSSSDGQSDELEKTGVVQGILRQPFTPKDFLSFLRHYGILISLPPEQAANSIIGAVLRPAAPLPPQESESESALRSLLSQDQPSPSTIIPDSAAPSDDEDDTAYHLSLRLYTGTVDERCEACQTIGRKRLHELLPILLGVIERDMEDILPDAAWALGEIGDSRALVHLTKLLERPGIFLRLRVLEALGKIGVPQAVSAIARIIATSDQELKLAATRALVKIGGPEASRILDRLSHDENEDVAREASMAVMELE